LERAAPDRAGTRPYHRNGVANISVNPSLSRQQVERIAKCSTDPAHLPAKEQLGSEEQSWPAPSPAKALARR